MAEHDLPAMLNYVQKQTNRSELYYAGHSQGTMVALAELSTNKQLASKVNLTLNQNDYDILEY